LDRDVLVWYCAAADQTHFLTNMQQVRQILEPEAAALAAINRSDEQLAAIEQALGGMRDAQSLATWNTHDVRFHLAVLTATGNELLVPLGFVIESALGNMFDYTARHNENFRKALPLHEDIYAAIRKRSPDAARRAVRRLLDDTNNVIGLPKNGAKPATSIGKTKGRMRHG
jgi:DNA-binding FadR family transcriptional regulator